MGIFELIFLAAGLSMDAFAVAVCKGLSLFSHREADKKDRAALWKSAVIVGLYFGFFQALMPLIGYVIGVQFSAIVASFGHWIAFGLLAAIGIGMIREGCQKEECPDCNDKSAYINPLSVRSMLPLAVATSIDALAAGVSFAFLQIDIVPAVSLIGIITLAFSMAGVGLGSLFGARFRSKAEIAGGIILILIGLKTLLENLGILSF